MARRRATPYTLVVAAVDADPAIKATADYLCDGIDDDIEIQAAIDAVPSGGTVIVVFGQGKPNQIINKPKGDQ